MIYHEHIYYYSLLTLKKFFSEFSLEIFNIKPIPIHGGSMRYYIRHTGKLENKKISLKLINLEKQEFEKGYNKKSTFLNYAKEVQSTKLNLMSLLEELKMKKIYSWIWSFREGKHSNTILRN